MRGLFSLMLAIPLATGCRDSGAEEAKPVGGVECGDGTYEEDGTCVPEEEPSTDDDGEVDGGASPDSGSSDTGAADDGMDTGSVEDPGGDVDTDGLYFLPYLLGERSPYWNPDARGAFVGNGQHDDCVGGVRDGW